VLVLSLVQRTPYSVLPQMSIAELFRFEPVIPVRFGVLSETSIQIEMIYSHRVLDYSFIYVGMEEENQEDLEIFKFNPLISR